MFTTALQVEEEVTHTSPDREITNEEYTVWDLSFHLLFFFPLLLILFL